MWWCGSSSAALRRLLGDRRGTTAIEFAFIGLIFLMLLIGAVDFGRYQMTLHSLRNIAAEGARVALLNANLVAAQQANGNPDAAVMNDAAIKNAVASAERNLTPFLSPGELTIATERATSATGVRTITVTATYPFQFLVPVLNDLALDRLSGSASLSY